MEIEINHHFSDGLYAKETLIPYDTFLMQHKHTYAHMSILAKGRVLVKVDDEIKEYKAPACINVEANKHHSVKALEDCVWYCVHATDEKNIDKIDKVLITKGE